MPQCDPILLFFSPPGRLLPPHQLQVCLPSLLNMVDCPSNLEANNLMQKSTWGKYLVESPGWLATCIQIGRHLLDCFPIFWTTFLYFWGLSVTFLPGWQVGGRPLDCSPALEQWVIQLFQGHVAGSCPFEW